MGSRPSDDAHRNGREREPGSVAARRHYVFHGVGLQVISDSPELLDALHYRLSPLTTLSPHPADLSVHLTYEFRRATSPAALPPPPGREPGPSRRAIFETSRGRALYDPATDVLDLDYGPIQGECHPADGWTRFAFHAPDEQLSSILWWLSHHLFTLTLTELLKRHGYYFLHAAAVAREGKGWVLVGASRSGKSTLALALTRRGWGYLGDDTLFLRSVPQGGGAMLPGARPPRAGELEIVGFPETADITGQTAAYFPELRPYAEEPSPEGWTKRPLDVPRAYGIEPVESCRPAAVVFPRIGEGESSRIEPICARDAQRRMVPLVLLTEPRSTQAHLDALMRLGAEYPCFAMETGRDFDALPERLERMLPGGCSP